MMRLPPDKKTARQIALKQRKAAHRAANPHDIAARLAMHMGAAGLIPRAPMVVGGYRAMGSEISADALMRDLAARGHDICLPVVTPEQRVMAFHGWDPARPDAEQGAPAALGHFEPHGSAACDPDIILVPLLACDRAGVRLGRGGGHYDATLAALKTQRPRRFIGLAYQAQIVSDCPRAPHDMALDALVTEHQCLFFADDLRAKLPKALAGLR